LEFVSRKNDVRMITIPTNGICSDKIFEQTKKILNNIKKDTHLKIALSVEGIGKKHDEIVQVKEAFKNIQDSYHKLHSLKKYHKNINIDIGVCCSAFNKSDVKETLKYCNEYFKGCTVEHALARGDTRNKLAKDVTPEEYRDVINYSNRLKEARKLNKPLARIFNSMEKIVYDQVIQIMKTNKMPSRCYTYSKMIVIQSNGDVFPCEHLPKNLGNLRDNNYDIKKILNKESNRNVEKYIKSGKCWCTWECALFTNIIYNPKIYFRLLKGLMISTNIKNTQPSTEPILINNPSLKEKGS